MLQTEPTPNVGAKSRNLANLRGKLPAQVKLPASVTVPLGSFEAVLKDKRNKDVARQLDEYAKLAHAGRDPAQWLPECRRVIQDKLVVPEKGKKKEGRRRKKEKEKKKVLVH